MVSLSPIHTTFLMAGRFEDDDMESSTRGLGERKTSLVLNRIREYSFVLASRFPFRRTTTNCFPSGENLATRPLEAEPPLYSGSPRRVIRMESATVTRRSTATVSDFAWLARFTGSDSSA